MVKMIAPQELKKTLGTMRLESTTKRVSQGSDEFNHARMFIEIAERYLALGELAGALDAINTAEEFAAQARYSAPMIWCELARFYGPIPMAEAARRCIRTAQSKMSFAAPPGVAVLPGDETGRWIPEYDLDEYQDEINETEQELGKAAAFVFDPAATAELLCRGDPVRRLTIQTELEKKYRTMW
jgi:hypothetical protein